MVFLTARNLFTFYLWRRKNPKNFCVFKINSYLCTHDVTSYGIFKILIARSGGH